MELFFILFQSSMLVLLYVTLVARSIMLYSKDGINPLVLGKGKKRFNAILEYLFVIGLLIWSFEIISHLMNLQFHIIPVHIVNNILVNNLIIKCIGVVLIAAGYVIFILALIAFKNSWRIGIDKNTPGKLITKGMFSITRNPIFVYLDLYFIGTALVNTNLFFIVFSIIVIAGIHYQILQEENFLKGHYGVDYIKLYEKSEKVFIKDSIGKTI